MSGSSDDEWVSDESEAEPPLEGQQDNNEGDHQQPQHVPNGFAHGRAWDDPWKKFKMENEIKSRGVLADRREIDLIKKSIKTVVKRQSYKYRAGFTHQDLHSRLKTSEGAFDIFQRLLLVEADLVKLILEYCDTVTLRAARGVSKLWEECVDKWYYGREDYLLNQWASGDPSISNYPCQVNVSCVAADDFTIAAGLENGKIQVFNRLTGECDLLFVGHSDMVTAIQVRHNIILSAGREKSKDALGAIQVWNRDTGRHHASLRPPFKNELKDDDAFVFLLYKHSYVFAMGIDRDVWIYQEKSGALIPSSLTLPLPEFSSPALRIKAHYSQVICADFDALGRVMTGSHDAQVRLWNLGPNLRDRTKKISCHNQHGNPITSVEVRWPLGMSASSGSVRVFHHPTGACLRTFRFSAYVFDLHFNENHFITSHQDGALNFWSMDGCLQEELNIQKTAIFCGKIVIKPALEDQQVWGNKYAQRQGRFVHERSSLVTFHHSNISTRDMWAAAGRRLTLEDIGRGCDTPSSLPSLVSDVSEDEDWNDDEFIPQAILNGNNL